MNFIKEHKSITEAMIDTKINSIGPALRGKTKTAGGYIWR